MEENTSSAVSLLVRNYVELVSIFQSDKRKLALWVPNELKC